jgi:hypothetical protein
LALYNDAPDPNKVFFKAGYLGECKFKIMSFCKSVDETMIGQIFVRLRNTCSLVNVTCCNTIYKLKRRKNSVSVRVGINEAVS